MNEFDALVNERSKDIVENCSFCKESTLGVGDKTPYGSVIVGKFGSDEKGWFATVSPKTGGDVEQDFTLQLMPNTHLTHFSQMDEEEAKNYGIAFSKTSKAVTKILAEDEKLKAVAENRETGIPVATWGKCTTWKEKKEHLHLKIFPFRGKLGQPSIVDSSFEKKEIHHDGEEHVKMTPIKKELINVERFEELSNTLISLLK